MNSDPKEMLTSRVKLDDSFLYSCPLVQGWTRLLSWSLKSQEKLCTIRMRKFKKNNELFAVQAGPEGLGEIFFFILKEDLYLDQPLIKTALGCYPFLN